MTREKLYQLRDLIHQIAIYLPDKDAINGIELFPIWKVGEEYTVEKRVRYNNKLYRCEQPHTSQLTWNPEVAPALWTEVAPPDKILVWKQPTGAQDSYNKNDKVYYPNEDGDIWISDIDNNVWEPGVYGWKKEEK